MQRETALSSCPQLIGHLLHLHKQPMGCEAQLAAQRYSLFICVRLVAAPLTHRHTRTNQDSVQLLASYIISSTMQLR